MFTETGQCHLAEKIHSLDSKPCSVCHHLSEMSLRRSIKPTTIVIGTGAEPKGTVSTTTVTRGMYAKTQHMTQENRRRYLATAVSTPGRDGTRAAASSDTRWREPRSRVSQFSDRELRWHNGPGWGNTR